MIALPGLERSEKPFLHTGYDWAGCNQALASFFGKVNCVGAAVAGGRASLGQTLLLQFVDQVDHRRFVDLQDLDELLLAQTSPCEQQRQDSEVPDTQVQGEKSLGHGGAHAAVRPLQEEAGLARDDIDDIGCGGGLEGALLHQPKSSRQTVQLTII